ncbi:DUF6134 family protein [Acidocella sp.]|uniref:DUF6134 family protein n=1 Tax=Acidocella sp. TaxID=50710 RepID=UPI003D08DFE5
MKLMRQKLERRGFLAGAAALAATRPALAAPLPIPPGNEMRFKILRNGSPIGEQHMKFTQSGDDLRVDINADLVVTLAGIPVFHYRASAVERWSGGHFSRLDSQVNHNGTKLSVQADPIPGGYAVQSTKAGDYEYTGQPKMLPLTYWNKAMLKAMILNVETGRHYPAIVNSPGWNKLPTAEGGFVIAQRFNVTGKLHLSVWYDQYDQWSGLAFNVDGHETFQKYMT